MFNVHLTPTSTNAKTGPIPVSTTDKNSCPDSCPLKSENTGGCYAGVGPLNVHWNKITNGERGTSWSDFVAKIDKLGKGQLWRHNQAGDLPHKGGVIDRSAMADLVKANHGKRGFTYTHHDLSVKKNYDIVREANSAGFAINASANNPAEAVQFKKDYPLIPVVSVVPLDFWGDKQFIKKGGQVFVRCPAEYKDGVNCSNCQVCAVSARSSIIGFTVHGTSKKKANLIASDQG